MQTIRINHEGKDYKITVAKSESNSNYNTFVTLYNKGDRHPIYGTSVKDGTTTEQVKELALNHLKNREKAQQIF